ncbi:unnamed protein product [Vicia faba]|uniref:TF-B3 domain-containing protein n=1 Tax=Vicia faba TaxID=3906 RepID=A0AAV0ZG92_VICFA|nr:unnamed protein product [Vicia faba]
MAGGNSTLPICFFKIILQTNLQTIKIPNKFTRSHGVGLPNPMFIKPPDGTKWKMFWKNINEGTSELDVVILGQNALEIDYDSKCDTVDILNVDDSDDESDEILNEWLNRKKVRQKSPLVSTRAHKKVRGEIEKNTDRPSVPNLQGVIENKKTNVMIQIGERSWNLKLLPCYNNIRSCRLSAGWSLFARESGLQPGDVCIFELINKKDLVFKVHVF